MARTIDIVFTASASKFTRGLRSTAKDLSGLRVNSLNTGRGVSRAFSSMGGAAGKFASTLNSANNSVSRSQRAAGTQALAYARQQAQVAQQNEASARAQALTAEASARREGDAAKKAARDLEVANQRKIRANAAAAQSLHAYEAASIRAATSGNRANREDKRVQKAKYDAAKTYARMARVDYTEAASLSRAADSAARRTATSLTNANTRLQNSATRTQAALQRVTTAENALGSTGGGGFLSTIGVGTAALGGLAFAGTKVVTSLVGLGVQVGQDVFGLIETGAKAAAIGVIGVTAAVGGLATALAADVFKQGLNRSLDIQDAKAKLTQFGYSAKKIQGIMTDVQNAVIGTRFNLNEGATAATTALAAGIKPGKELTSYLQDFADLATLGNTSISDIGVALTDAAASGRVYKRDLNQLAARSIPIFTILQKQYHVTGAELNKMVSKGEISLKGLLTAFEHSKFAGAAGASANTARGAFLNLQAALARLGEKFLDSPVNAAPKTFKQIGKAVDRAAKSLDPLADRFGKFAGTQLGKLSKLAQGFDFKRLEKGFEAAFNIADKIAPVAFTAFSAIGSIVSDVGSAANKLSQSDGFSSLVNSVQSAITTATPVVGAFVDLFEQGLENVAPVIGYITDGISTSLQPALDSAQPFIDKIGRWFADTFTKTNIDNFFSGAGTLLSHLLTQSGKIFDAFSDPEVQKAVKNIGGVILKLADANTWGPAVVATIKDVAKAFNGIGKNVQTGDAVQQAADGFTELDNMLNGRLTQPYVKGKFNGLYNEVIHGIQEIDKKDAAKQALIDSMTKLGVIGGTAFGDGLNAAVKDRQRSILESLVPSSQWADLQKQWGLDKNGHDTKLDAMYGGRYGKHGKDTPKAAKPKSAADEERDEYNRIKAFNEGLRQQELSEAAARRAKEKIEAARKALQEFKSTAQESVTGFLTGIGTIDFSEVKSRINSLASLVKSAFTKGYITQGTYGSLSDLIRDDNTKLEALAKKRDKIADKIKSANELVKNIKSGLTEKATVTGGGSYSDIRRSLQQTLAAANGFSSAFGSLQGLGLNTGALSQLVQQFISDPVAGLGSAKALIRAGKGGISQINSLQSQIKAVGDKFAPYAADTIYDSGKHAGDGFLAGLKSRKAEIEDEMVHFGNTLAGTVGKALNLKVAPVAANHAAKAAAAVKRDAVKANPSAVSARATGGTQTVHHHVTIQQSIPAHADKVAIGKATHESLDAYYKTDPRKRTGK